ncbi:SDR family oxidoreductase [Paenibacillus tuaregi]|uniref:SDR family oxidoreductase n=1 Tax=Paenibacillus tuaregi TaxID=1816681 RepID=UPI0008393881|nr:SDR family oxidoreductase [Paenibacillus tuaregi]
MASQEVNQPTSGLNSKRIIFLGGTSGIGFATAKKAAGEGASVVVVSSRKEKVHAALSRLPQGSEGHIVDLTSEEQISTFFNGIGQFDHLVYTAGDSLQFTNLHDMDTEAAHQMFNLRYWGALWAAKYGSPHINPGGSILFTSGVAGTRPPKGLSVAASVCGAIEALTRALAVELGPIRVNTACFGIMRTELWDTVPEAERDAMYEAAASSLPVGYLGEPGDGAEVFLYLMKEKYSTGQVVVVDGGSILV